MNKSMIKKNLKKTIVYSAYKKMKIYKEYSNKYNIGLVTSFEQIKFIDYDLSKILKKANIKNIGYGDFFYTLDHTIKINHNSFMIGNMPVDYNYIINTDISNSGIDIIIKEYVNRINDTRINLKKPTDLKSALQSILFWNSLLWQTGHTLVGLGRLDKVLAPYKITEDSEKLICDFLKTLHTEYEYKSASLKGDTGQIIILGGLEENGQYFYNEYTKLFIKCLNKLHLPDPKILVRCSANMPMELLELSMECNASGIGSPLFSNDDVIIPYLIEFGYDSKDAYNYGVSACWEPLSIGNSLEQNNLAHIEYGKCINETILDARFTNVKNINDVFDLYFEKLKANCQIIMKGLDDFRWQRDPLLSMMMGLNKDISEGGAKYNNYGILSVGMASAINSLLNIEKYVFDENKYSLSEIQKIIFDNYKGGEETLFANNENGYGTDSDKAVEYTNRLIQLTEDIFRDYRNMYGGKVKFGLSSPVYIDFGKTVGATLDGRKSGEPFQTHISRDKGEPITEIMNFESKLKFSGISCNANVLDVMVQSSLIKDNIDKFALYVMGGIKEGIFQLQINALSYAQLVEAKANPHKYPNLIVRVWGFSAYFNDLPEEYKDNLIRRAKEMEHII